MYEQKKDKNPPKIYLKKKKKIFYSFKKTSLAKFASNSCGSAILIVRLKNLSKS
jgi:hypothetical protein